MWGVLGRSFTGSRWAVFAGAPAAATTAKLPINEKGVEFGNFQNTPAKLPYTAGGQHP